MKCWRSLWIGSFKQQWFRVKMFGVKKLDIQCLALNSHAIINCIIHRNMITLDNYLKPLALPKHSMLKTLENLSQQLYQLSFFESLQISLSHIPRLHRNLYSTWHTKNHILNGMLVNAFSINIISHIILIFSLMTYKSHAKLN